MWPRKSDEKGRRVVLSTAYAKGGKIIKILVTAFKRKVRDRIIAFLKMRGYYVAKPHYYNPIPNKEYLLSHNGYQKRPYPCYNIEFHDDDQLALCKRL